VKATEGPQGSQNPEALPIRQGSRSASPTGPTGPDGASEAAPTPYPREWVGDHTNRRAAYAQARLDLIEDVETLLAGGANGDDVAARLYMSKRALTRRLQRAGRHDLARAVDRVAVNRRWL
jgi:hypothetical protein